MINPVEELSIELEQLMEEQEFLQHHEGWRQFYLFRQAVMSAMLTVSVYLAVVFYLLKK